MSKRILAIVVTYHPDKALLEKNISAFISSVEKVLVWENTPGGQKRQYRFGDNSKVEYCGDGINSISHALNYAWRYAEKERYDYLLTMDQDSVFENFSHYLEYTIRNTQAPQGIWIPLAVTGENKPALREKGQDIKEVFFGNTSGMLLKISVIGRIGGWNEAFAVDGVDCEFCFHASRVGVKIYAFLNVFLYHQLGEYKKVKFLNRFFELRNYSPVRYYTIYKSHVLLMRLFPEQKEFLNTCRYYWGGMIKWIFMFESHRFRKMYYIVKGIAEGCLTPLARVKRINQ